MALTQRLELKQGQALVMTPQLQQAIKLLQLSNLELAEYVETELEKNPLLEREDPEAIDHRTFELELCVRCPGVFVLQASDVVLPTLDRQYSSNAAVSFAAMAKASRLSMSLRSSM